MEKLRLFFASDKNIHVYFEENVYYTGKQKRKRCYPWYSGKERVKPKIGCKEPQNV